MVFCLHVKTLLLLMANQRSFLLSIVFQAMQHVTDGDKIESYVSSSIKGAFLRVSDELDGCEARNRVFSLIFSLY